MARPASVGTFADDLFEAVEPLAYADGEPDWALWSFCNALALQFQTIEDLARDTDELPGWAVLMDPDETPDIAVPFLAQFVCSDIGERLPDDTDAAYWLRARERIKELRCLARGSLDGFKSVVAETLTGTKTVTVVERIGLVDTATITIASPAVVTRNSHGLSANDTVKFSTTGALPTGITAGTTYYVLATGLTSNTFRISATAGGAAINTSGSQSGVHTLTEMNAYAFRVSTATGETPDPTMTEMMAREHKPAGLRMIYTTV
jgi:hypothetical protein